MSHSRLESTVTNEILAAVGAVPGFLIHRNPVGEAVYVNEHTGRRYTTPYGLGDGSPDLVGSLSVGGRPAVMLGLEVKVPGKRPRPNQRKCHEVWRAFGRLVYTVTSAAEALAALDDARSKL